MILNMHITLAQNALKAGSKNVYLKQIVEEGSHWHNIDSKFLENDDIKILLKLLEKDPPRVKRDGNEEYTERTNKEIATGYKRLKSRFNTLVKLSTGQDICTVKIKRLETLAEAIKKFFITVPNNWFFADNYDDGVAVPFLLTDCTFHPAKYQRGEYIPAKVSLTGTGYNRGEHETISFSINRQDTHSHDTIGKIMEHLEIAAATPDMIAEYKDELQKHKEVIAKTGAQYLATGVARPSDKTDHSDESDDDKNSRYYKHDLQMERSGELSKVVIDDEMFKSEKESQVIENTLFAKVAHEDRDETEAPDEDEYEEDDDEDDDRTTSEKLHDKKLAKKENIVEMPEIGTLLPLHPRLIIFDLKRHQHFEIHASNLTAYTYDAKLGDKLVLPVDKKSLIDVLLASAQIVQQDIVQGKTGGTIILCSGAPGTGKTLTAEVYGEVAQRPLYVVQCSQLGTDADALERHLQHVLDRAIRWNAVLLIDEADVYIHERGNDLEQNAIVGVFLRLLEYYSGVMFLTTNRATVVDDAIASRMMAHVRYTVPKNDLERRRIWGVLSTQYKVEMTGGLIDELIKEYPDISGRSIKQLLKLAKVLTDSKTRKLNLDLFKWLCQFQDTEAKGVVTE